MNGEIEIGSLITIVDMQSKTVFDGYFSNSGRIITIDVEKGIYLLHIQHYGLTYTKKLAIQ